MSRKIKSAIIFSIACAILGVVQGARLVHGDATSTATTGTTQSSSTLQTELDQNNDAIATLNQQIATYQAELQQVGANKKTLQAAINGLDLQKEKAETQVTLTEDQIKTTQIQLDQLSGQITDTQSSITDAQTSLGAYLRSLQKAEDQPLFMQMLSSDDITQAWNQVNATLQAEGAVELQMQTLQDQENTLASSRTETQQKNETLASQQQSLVAQQQSIATTIQSKNQLLTETNAQESNYEKLLAAAEAQLAQFSAFTQNAGGSKLVGNQTVCDAWGCYYNQRDSAWGNDPLNGTKYNLASDGCLVTAMAMVMTHYGYRDVTPVTINSNPGNFAAYYPAYLLTTITVDGATATRKSAAIDATLATGNPVIVGLNAYGGTHYVVLVSGSAGNYLMRDPYVANADNIPFTSHYSMREIFGVTKVNISS